jgi:hypothetical protein
MSQTVADVLVNVLIMTTTTGSAKSAAHSNYGLNRSSALSTAR